MKNGCYPESETAPDGTTKYNSEKQMEKAFTAAVDAIRKGAMSSFKLQLLTVLASLDQQEIVATPAKRMSRKGRVLV